MQTMKFPMRAIVKCNVGKAEYPPGVVFDALEIDNVNYLKVTRSAEVTEQPEDPKVEADSQTVADQSAKAETPAVTTQEVDMSTQGTTNDLPISGDSGRGRTR